MQQNQPDHRTSNAKDQVKTCWICFDTSAGSSSHSDWIEPCQCIGSTRWVHHSCLSRWIDRTERSLSASNQENSSIGFFSLSPSAMHSHPVCPQCRNPYMINDNVNPLLFALEYSKFLYSRILLISSAVGVASCIYLVSFSYGYSVCTAVYGSDEFLSLINAYLSSDTEILQEMHLGDLDIQRGAFVVRLVAGLPLIPAAILSASFKYMSWLYATIPALMLFGERNVQLQWPLSPRLVISIIPYVFSSYRFLRGLLQSAINRHIAKMYLHSEFSRIASTSLSDTEDVGEFLREATSLFPLSYALSSDSSSAAFIANDDSAEFFNNNDTVDADRPVTDTQRNAADDDSDDTEVRIVMNVKRIIDSLLVPFVGSAIGRLLFRKSTTIQSRFYRSIFGIGLFILATDAGVMLMKYWKIRARMNRKIMNIPKGI